MEVIDWIIDNKETLLAGAGMLLAGAAILCKLTPSPKDDKLIAKILAFLNLVPKSTKK